MAKPLDYMPQCSQSDVHFLLSTLYPLPSLETSGKTTNPYFLTELSRAGEYHQIWTCLLPTSSGPLQPAIFRISGQHIPHFKTENEVAVLKWLRANTSSIQVPNVLAVDSSTNNVLGHEYMLMERLPGASGLEVWRHIPEGQMNEILQRLAKFHVELFQKPFDHLGGLRVGEGGEVVPGPCVEEVLWHEPDIKRYWPDSESYESLNPMSRNGYPSFAEWSAAHMECYIHGIKRHGSLSWITKDEIKMLEDFVRQLREADVIAEFGNVPLRLAHQDLHFGQLLIDVDGYEMTGIIDWEFSQVVPVPLWRKSFLWLGDSTLGKEKSESLYERWQAMVLELDGGDELIAAMEWPTEDYKSIWDACNYLRCVVEVCPRGQQEEDARRWWQEVLKAITDFNEPEDECKE